MKDKLQNKYVAWGVTLFSVFAGLILLFFTFYRWDYIVIFLKKVLSIFSPVIYGLVIAYILSPIVNFFDFKVFRKIIKKKSSNKTSRVLALSTSTIIFIGVIVASISLLLPSVVRSIDKFITNANTYLVDSKESLVDLIGDGSISDYINDNFDKFSKVTNDWLKDGALNDLVVSVGNGIFGVLKFLYNTVIGFIISIYILFDKEKFKAQIKKLLYTLFKNDTVKMILENINYTDKIFSDFFSAKLLDSLIVGVLCFVGCFLIGIPYSLVVAVMVGVTNVIPYFGPIIGAVPSALLILLVSPSKCITFLIFVFVLQQFDGSILGPKILGSKTGLSSFWVLFSLLVFGGLFGVVGMIIGVPIFSILYSFINGIVKQRLENKNLPLNSKDYEKIEYVDEKTGKPVYK